ncbi:DUF4435 domain-containing protein [Vibrio campbellii]|uniref:DUF4435 domain-containing protein n=1 Tax=Vibrio campbellii TaxID=680 RepID=UPI0003A071F5|nr:DUF4435 domain-containing protein [Vibrio campbellii]
MRNEVHLPMSGNSGASVAVSTEGTMVIIGPNGAGKTRLGSWMEFGSPLSSSVHRISAQKSLVMPDSISPQNLEKANKIFVYGTDGGTSSAHKRNSRWNRNPETSMLNDYQQLMLVLFSEDYEISTAFRQQVREANAIVGSIPESKLDVIKDVWSLLLPHRELHIGGGRIMASPAGVSEAHYNGSQMSDGERVIFYLLGQALAAPKNSIIVIDEPEIHLHKTVQYKLWDAIESIRADCIFVYLTHDFEFAASRQSAVKICITKYDGSSWVWNEIPTLGEMPESILLEVMGSRKPILFIEGEKGSIDEELYKLIYDDYYIRPLGSCSKVIEATKVFNSLSDLHNNVAYGIIDRDRRTQEELVDLEVHKVFSPSVSEVENLFLTEEVILGLADALAMTEPSETLNQVKDFVFEEFEKFKSKHAAEHTTYQLNQIFGGADFSGKSIEAIELKFQTLVSEVDLRGLHSNFLVEANQVLEHRDYEATLRIFNHKGLLAQVGKLFDVKPNAFILKAKNIIKKDVNLQNKLKKSLPTIIGS